MKKKNISIRYAIFIYFTITALVANLLIIVSLYQRWSIQSENIISEDNRAMTAQIAKSVESYLRNAMKLSDTIYYGIIKNADLNTENINSNMRFLYENNKENVNNIAVFYKSGNLYDSMPAAMVKDSVNVAREPWFQSAIEKSENQHFSIPHVQTIFVNNENQYRWVISLSRAIELTKNNSTYQGVLLIDLNYSGLQHLLEGVNVSKDNYKYLIDGEGNIIYHPQMQLIDAGHTFENNKVAATYNDGKHTETFNGHQRIVIVKSIGYTGWKIVSVTPKAFFSLNTLKTRLLIVFITALILFFLAVINSYISSKITDPIKELEKSVAEIEAGNLNTEVYIGGSYEIRHLGKSISSMAKQIRILMDDVVQKSEAKRKQEFDTLQSQINPHFLYNTLDIIVWMIENEQKDKAVQVVTALARFFRISLSKGKSIIDVEDEIEHVRNYLMIQNMRFKNKFTYEINVQEECYKYKCLKLMLQPIVENAIYHGMEFMDGDGIIEIDAQKTGDNLKFTVTDNGLGMTEEMVDNLLLGNIETHSRKGSGIGVKNVNERIKLYFGEEYGLNIISEPDEGTTVIITLPAMENYD